MQVTGIVIIKLNSKSVRCAEGKMTLKLGGMERTPKIADGIVIGYNEKVVPAELECTSLHTAQTDIEDVRNCKNGTILIITDTGKKYVMREAFSTEPGEIKGGDGDYDLKFASPPVVES